MRSLLVSPFQLMCAATTSRCSVCSAVVRCGVSDAFVHSRSALLLFRRQSLSFFLSFPPQEPVTMWHRGRGRGALGSYPMPATRCGAAAAPAVEKERPALIGSEREALMDVRVTEVMDPGSFWAQIDHGRGSRNERCLGCSLRAHAW